MAEGYWVLGASVRILAIKGGGLRGLLSARMANRLESNHPGWAHKADLIAGTSTGGIIALGIAAGLPISSMVRLYEQYSSKIFADSTWDNIKDLSVGGVSLRGAQYSSEGLHDVLVRTFDDLTLGELHIDVLIPAFDLDNRGDPRRWKPKFYSARHDPDELVVDVAMRTSAAPTYFPTYQGFIDGGVVCNDPSIAALAYAIREGMHDGMASLMIGGVKLFCLGTGQMPKFIEGEDSKDWGGLQWVRHLLDIFMDGGLMVPVYEAATVLGENYYHLNPQLDEEIPLDCNAYKGESTLNENMAKLLEVANAVDLEEANAWLACHWRKS